MLIKHNPKKFEDNMYGIFHAVTYEEVKGGEKYFYEVNSYN